MHTSFVIKDGTFGAACVKLCCLTWRALHRAFPLEGRRTTECASLFITRKVVQPCKQSLSALSRLTACCLARVQYNPVSYAAAGGAANQLFPPTTPAGGWGMETILTFCLVYMVLSATDSERAVDAPHLPVRARAPRLDAGHVLCPGACVAAWK